MKCCRCLSLVGAAALITASFAFAQDKPAAKAPPAGDHQLPPGWTEADMQACMEAGTPGPMHAYLNESVGTWNGKVTMWMAPGAEPMVSECKTVIAPKMDGRFVSCETTGDLAGMGPFHGYGLYGYDNVSEEFQATWIDNCGTGMMQGTGDLSSDQTTLTWTYNYTCPITKKPVVMKEIDRREGKNKSTMEMHGTDPKTGKEFKMMQIEYTRAGAAPAAPATLKPAPAKPAPSKPAPGGH